MHVATGGCDHLIEYVVAADATSPHRMQEVTYNISLFMIYDFFVYDDIFSVVHGPCSEE